MARKLKTTTTTEPTGAAEATETPDTAATLAEATGARPRATVEDRAASALVQSAPLQQRRSTTDPTLSTGYAGIVETVFTLDDPDALYERLVEALSLKEALTPNVLADTLNHAESRALDAHRLYVCAKADYDRYEHECTPIIDAMRDAANKELQDEKDKKLRSKAITDADVKGRAHVLFPDEWARLTTQMSRAEGMLDNLKQLAKLWEQRCYSLSSLLNAGKSR